MTSRMVAATLLVASVAVLGSATAANADETRQFRGEGSSSKGLAYYYAYADAMRQAQNAGFTDCVEIDSYIWPSGYDAWVLVECTR